MEKNKFYKLLIEELEIESIESVNENTKLDSIEEWDSMAAMTMIAIADEYFGKKVSAKDIESFNTIKDIIVFIGEEHFKN